jgi:hypothetical protein
MKCTTMVGLVFLCLTGSHVSANGILNVSFQEVVATLGQPISHKTGTAGGMGYDQYFFSTNGWNTSVFFIAGVSLRINTEKADDSPLTADQKKAILDACDIQATGSPNRGWREVNATHLVRGDRYVHIFTRITTITVVLKTLPSELWP